MLQIARWRVILVAVVTAMGIAFSAFPNFSQRCARPDADRCCRSRRSTWVSTCKAVRTCCSRSTPPRLQHQQLDNIAEQMATALRDAEPSIRFTGRGVVGDAARIRLINAEDMTRAMAAMRPLAQSATGGGDEIATFTESGDGLIEARMTDASLRELSRQASGKLTGDYPSPDRPDRREMKSIRCAKAITALSCKRQVFLIRKSSRALSVQTALMTFQMVARGLA